MKAWGNTDWMDVRLKFVETRPWPLAEARPIESSLLRPARHAVAGRGVVD